MRLTDLQPAQRKAEGRSHSRRLDRPAAERAAARAFPHRVEGELVGHHRHAAARRRRIGTMLTRSLTSVAALTCCAPAGGADFPRRAAGLWGEKMTSGTGAVSHRICVDEKLTDFLKGPAVCSKQD